MDVGRTFFPFEFAGDTRSGEENRRILFDDSDRSGDFGAETRSLSGRLLLLLLMMLSDLMLMLLLLVVLLLLTTEAMVVSIEFFKRNVCAELDLGIGCVCGAVAIFFSLKNRRNREPGESLRVFSDEAAIEVMERIQGTCV